MQFGDGDGKTKQNPLYRAGECHHIECYGNGLGEIQQYSGASPKSVSKASRDHIVQSTFLDIDITGYGRDRECCRDSNGMSEDDDENGVYKTHSTEHLRQDEIHDCTEYRQRAWDDNTIKCVESVSCLKRHMQNNSEKYLFNSLLWKALFKKEQDSILEINVSKKCFWRS